MSRFDISRLRKEKGMSQGELAARLQMTQSFLSAIENGKSPLPIEKEEKLCEVFNLKDLSAYVINRREDHEERKLTEMTDSDLFNQLLSRFHKQAHSGEDEAHHHDHHARIDELQEEVSELYARNQLLLERNDAMMKRNDSLMERNDRLSIDNDRLRAEIDNYRSEIDSLREQIFKLKSLK